MTNQSKKNGKWETETLLDSIVSTINEGIFVVDKSGEIVFFNDKFLDLCNINKSEAELLDSQGLSIAFANQLINPDAFISELEEFRKSTKLVFDNLNCKDGRIFERYTRVIVKDAKPIRRIYCFRDITKESLLGKSVSESFTKLNRIVKNTLDAIVLIDEKEKIILWNPAAERILGFSEEEVLNKSYDKVILKLDLETEISKNSEEVVKNISKYFLRSFNKADKPINAVLNYAGGEKKYLEAHLFEIKVQEGIWIGINFRDITARKIADQKLESYMKSLEFKVTERTEKLTVSNKQLERAIEKEKETQLKLVNSLEKEKELSELKSRFISTASHEFRNPLASISFSAELLKKYGDSVKPEVKTELIDDILESVSQLTDLMNDVLAVSHSEVTQLKLNVELVDMKEFCFEVIDSVKWLLTPEHSVVTEIDIASKKMIDKKLLKLILSNILSNAIKYSPDGGEIRFKLNEKKEYLLFTVTDNGIGIPAEQQKNVFEQFFRGDNAFNITGTGLGLDITKRSIDIYNGKIYFESGQDEGTIFYIEIPVIAEGDDYDKDFNN